MKAGVRLSTAMLCGLVVALSACTSSGPKVTTVAAAKQTRSKEYFAEKDYGVKASPRVINVAMASVPGMKMKRLPRGGGRDQVGKPYKVRGKWYVPQEDPNYKAAGIASWYGDAFHGRLTANGEIYDMNHLSAAHPTMPLPSYARVTNKANGSSVIVRVNDRGPYAHGRVIDLSKRAAQLLDYTHKGTAQVVVEYVGRAPVDGADDEYLMASYRPGNGGSVDEIQPGVMIAMAGDTLPGVGEGGTLALAGGTPATPRNATAAGNLEPYDPFTGEAASILPASGPLPTARPSACGDLLRCDTGAKDLLISGYADERVAAGHKSAKAFDALIVDEAAERAWAAKAGYDVVHVGVFAKAPSMRLARIIGKSGALRLDTEENGSVSVYVQAKSGKAADAILRKLWKAGFDEAFVIR
jgi:rare lipoprotein A